MVFVASSSRSGSASSVINSMALKNFTALGLGLPNGRSFPALTRMATSSVEQFNSLATYSASNRAGKSFAAHVAITACVMSSVIIRPFSFGHTYSTSYPVRPATRPRAPRAGRWSGLAGSHQNIQRRNRSVFYPLLGSAYWPQLRFTAPTPYLLEFAPACDWLIPTEQRRQLYLECYRRREPPG